MRQPVLPIEPDLPGQRRLLRQPQGLWHIVLRRQANLYRHYMLPERAPLCWSLLPRGRTMRWRSLLPDPESLPGSLLRHRLFLPRQHLLPERLRLWKQLLWTGHDLHRRQLLPRQVCLRRSLLHHRLPLRQRRVPKALIWIPIGR